MKPLLPSTILALATFGAASQGASLAVYDFENDSLADKATTTGITASSLTKGTALDLDSSFSNDATQGSRSLFARGEAVQQTNGSTSVAFPQALIDGNYVEFTISADPGYTFSLNSFTFDTAWQGINSGRMGVTSSINGHTYANRETITTELPDDASSISNILQSNLGGFPRTAVDAWGQGEDTAIDVTGSEFQDITSVTFRITGHSIADTGSASISNIFRLDDIRIDGDVNAIPEPSATTLLGLASCAFILRRRK